MKTSSVVEMARVPSPSEECEAEHCAGRASRRARCRLGQPLTNGYGAVQGEGVYQTDVILCLGRRLCEGVARRPMRSIGTPRQRTDDGSERPRWRWTGPSGVGRHAAASSRRWSCGRPIRRDGRRGASASMMMVPDVAATDKIESQEIGGGAAGGGRGLEAAERRAPGYNVLGAKANNERRNSVFRRGGNRNCQAPIMSVAVG